MPRPPRVLRELAIVLFFVAQALLATRPLAFDLCGQTLAGPDPLIDMWTVHWLSGHLLAPRQLFGGNIFYPDPNAVLYSDLSLGTAVLLAPLRVVVEDPVPLYNLGLLLALGFGGWCFHALGRELTGSLGAGLITGTLAAFGSHQLSHVYHLNLLTIGWLALLLLALHRLARAPSPGGVVLAGLSFALSAQSSGYYAVAALLLALCFGAVHWRPLLGTPRSRRAVFAAAALAAVLLAPYASAFLALREREGLRRPIGMSARMALRVDRDLTSYGYLYRGVLGSDGERFFPGLVGLGLGAVALTRRRPFAGFYALAATVLVVVALGPELALGDLRSPLPYRFLFRIPPLDAMRHPYTFAAVATMLLAVLAGLGFKALALERRPVVGAAAVLFAVAETLAPGPALRPVPPGVPPAYRSLASLAPGPVLELPVFEPETLIWAARHGRPVVNGVGAFTPLHTAVLERTVQNHWVRRTPEPIEDSDPIWELADHFADLRYVILPVGRDPTWSALAADFDRSRAFELALEASDGDRVYRFRREAVTSPDAGQRREEP